MQIKKVTDVPAQPVVQEGAQKVQVRVIFGPRDGAPTFAMRQFEIEPGGATPQHQHPFEHEMLVLQGQLTIWTEHGEIPVSAGDAIMVLPGERHQVRNKSGGPGKILCLVPVAYQK